MPEAFASPFVDATPFTPAVLVRLALAALLGAVVGWIYRRSRPAADITPTFPTTLILLAVLIAMVTQVIGTNIARAFGLVGALSIVRFRTVVRDTQDTAFVILSVVVGMAVGANDPWVALIGIGVTAIIMFVVRKRDVGVAMPAGMLPFRIRMRVTLGNDIQTMLEPVLAAHLSHYQLRSIETAKGGMLIEVSYDASIKTGASPEQLVKALNRIEGVQSVQIDRQDTDQEN